VSTATWIAAGLCALTAGLLIGWGLRWVVLDARERRFEKEAADRYLAHRASLRSDKYLRDVDGSPE
jgi:hypothetical protein